MTQCLLGTAHNNNTTPGSVYALHGRNVDGEVLNGVSNVGGGGVHKESGDEESIRGDIFMEEERRAEWHDKEKNV